MGTSFCPQCLAQIEPIVPPVCRRCGRPWQEDGLPVAGPVPGSVEIFVCPACQRVPSSLDGITATAIYDGPLREAIHSFKYADRHALAPLLGARLVATWRDQGLSADRIIPVPLHATRLKERGYNQSALLARVLAQAVGVPLDEGAVVRQKATRQQALLNAAERLENVKDAFVCRGGVAGLRIALVDDVTASGATLEACAAALRASGAASIWALALARPRWEGGRTVED